MHPALQVRFEYACIEDAEFLSEKAIQLAPHLLPVSQEEYEAAIRKQRVLIARTVTGQLHASLKLSPIVGTQAVEIGSVWARPQSHLASQLLQQSFHMPLATQAHILIMVTRAHNSIIKVGYQLGFSILESSSLAAHVPTAVSTEIIRRDKKDGDTQKRVVLAMNKHFPTQL